jgi:hypothetical protein
MVGAQKEAASPPLTFRGRAAQARLRG